MAQDNNGLRISQYDSGSAVYNSTTEFVEFGLEYGESMDLLPGAENGLAKSIKSSLSSTLTETISICGHIANALKWFLGTFKVFWIVAIYSVVGALVFMKIETPNDLESRREQRDFHLMARDVLSFNIRQIQESRRLDADYEIKQAIIQFEQNIGVSIPDENSIWTFWMSILYVGTIYTTIGYGNIACSTTLGRCLTVIYALIGIPMMLVVLNQTGEYLMKIVKKGASIVEDLVLFVGVKTRIVRIKSERSLARYIKISKTMTFLGLSSTSMPPKSMVIVPEAEKLKHSETDKNSDFTVDMSKTEKTDQKEDRDPPVLAALIVTIAWILASSAVFCLWEDWSYGTSIYFFFISTSTIGFGDVSPAHPEYMMAAFGVVIIGLALVSVCINLVQEWLSNWYMNFLQNMLQQYIDNQKNGDENAAKQFMTGFNSGQVKYFMPFISKRAGKEAMDQLKKEAKDKGFELPSALTDLDPETGKPAFLNASEKKIDEIIEKAQNEGKLSPTMMPTTTAIAIQASVYGDREIGQTQTELSWQFFEARMERGTEFEPHLAEKFGVDAGIEARPRMTTTAIQPEVSSIFQFWEENLKEKDEIEQQLENVVLARREASLEGDQTSEEATEIGLLRFLKSTGTQVQPEVVDSESQIITEKTDFGQQQNPKVAVCSTQTNKAANRTTKTQTMLTTCISTAEELKVEQERMKNELKAEFLKEKAERVEKASTLKKIVLSSAEKSSLAAKLLQIRQEKSRKLREEGKEISFDILQEKEILTSDLRKMREENARLLHGTLSIESDFDRNQRPSILSVSDDDVFLADSEADSSTSTLPGPQQFAVPSRLDFNRRLEQKRVKQQVEQGKQDIFEAGKGEEESDDEIADMGLKLVDSLHETSKDDISRPKSAVVSSTFEKNGQPTAKVELTQSQPILTVFGDGYEEVTLNVQLIRESLSSLNSSAQSQGVRESVSLFPGALSPAMRVHPELLSSGDLLASPVHLIEPVSVLELIPEDLPIDELESLIDFNDLFSEDDLKKSVDEEIELFFMSATGIQTELSYFDLRSNGMMTDPEKFANSAQTDLTALDDKRGPRSIVEAFVPKHATIWAQTAPMVTTESIQTDVEKEDKCVGGKVDYESIEIQTTEKETKEASSETTVAQNRIAIQTEQMTETKDDATQVETSQKNQTTETDFAITSTAVETGTRAVVDVTQTEEKIYSSSAVHVIVETADSSTETAKSPEKSDSATETDKLPKMFESSTETDEAPKSLDSSTETDKLAEMAESSVGTDKLRITSTFVDANERPELHEMFTETDGLIETSEITTETDPFVGTCEIATETEPLSKTVEVFTETDDLPRISETSMSTENATEIRNISTTTEPLPTMIESSMNTEPQIALSTTESSTETESPPEKIDFPTQTDEILSTGVIVPKIQTQDNVSQTESFMISSAISPQLYVHEQTAIQSEVSNLYKRTTSSESEQELTYMVDNATEQDYDLIMQHATTQFTIQVVSFGQQFNPELSDVSMQVAVPTKDEDSQTIQRVRTPSPIRDATVAYTNAWMQTIPDEAGNPPVLLEANISVASSLSSSAINEDDSEDEGDSTEPPEGDLSIEATFPASFFVQSITLTSDVETQVDLIHADAGTQVCFGDFTHDAAMQAEIEMVDRQTSLNSNDLEPEIVDVSYISPTTDGFFPWSDFDVVPAVHDVPDSEELSNQPSTAEESVVQETPEQQPGPSQPKEEETLFVRKKVVRKVRRKKAESVDSEESRESVQVQTKPFELDETRRQRMIDIGIQTGVLARVQHIYSKRGAPGGGSDQAGDIKRVTLKKVLSSDTLGISKSIPGSSLSLQDLLQVGPSSSTESMPGPSSSLAQPGPSESSEKSKMLALHGRHWERQQTVSDLRSRLEKTHKQSKSASDLFGQQKTASSTTLKSDSEGSDAEKKSED